jgi:hypothetical protein
MRCYGLDQSVLVKGPMERSCEDGNEFFGFHKMLGIS